MKQESIWWRIKWPTMKAFPLKSIWSQSSTTQIWTRPTSSQKHAIMQRQLKKSVRLGKLEKSCVNLKQRWTSRCQVERSWRLSETWREVLWKITNIRVELTLQLIVCHSLKKTDSMLKSKSWKLQIRILIWLLSTNLNKLKLLVRLYTRKLTHRTRLSSFWSMVSNQNKKRNKSCLSQSKDCLIMTPITSQS